MDIQHLVDRLEELIDQGRHVPMSRFTLIDEERALEIIDQMRISIPEQIEKATRIVNQRDRIVAQANEESTRMIDLARQKADEMTERDAIVQTARYRAQNIEIQARNEAELIRAEADAYVVEVLRELESHLLRTLTIVRNGINKVLQDREARNQQIRAQLQQQTPHHPPTPTIIPTEEPRIVEAKVMVEAEEVISETGRD